MKDSRRLLAAFFVLLLAGCVSKLPAPVVERGDGVATAPAKADTLYTVKRGDTLYSIALDHGVEYRDLAAWNNIENPNRIRVGQQLRVKPPVAAVVASGETVVTQPVDAAGGGAVEQRPLASAAAGPAPAASSSPLLKTEPKAGKLPYSEESLAMVQQRSPEAARSTPPATATAEPRVEAPPEVKPPSVDAVPAGPDDVAWVWPASGKLIAQFSDSGSKGITVGGKAGDPVLAAGDGKVVYSGTGLRGYGKLLIVKHNATFLSAYAHNQNLLVKEGQSVSKGQRIAEMGDTDSDQVKLHFEIRRQGKPVDPLKYLPQR